jgi:hypothetical protein
VSLANSTSTYVKFEVLKAVQFPAFVRMHPYFFYKNTMLPTTGTLPVLGDLPQTSSLCTTICSSHQIIND